ncbi:MAG: hypothetical protein LAT64_08995 [Phycisphaerales bacterium]|nr:hypothetical protein [Planctomycetota bacterium]MCH8508886.1 hypothetical protein [Phycisphaerales bacterium]
MRNLTCPFIPVIRNKTEAAIVKSTMPETDTVRISVDLLETMPKPTGLRLWVDLAFDGFEFVFGDDKEIWKQAPSGWHKWAQSLQCVDCMATEEAARNAAQGDIDRLVASAMDRAAEFDPAAISVPQVPYTTSANRHSINKKLATAAGKWKTKNWSNGTLILPAVLSHSDAYRIKTVATPRVNAIVRSLESSRATGVWISHAGFDDLGGQGNLANEKFPSIISFHEQVNDALPSKTFTCAGPYWALNLILWARKLIDVPLLACGSKFQHNSPRPVQLLGRQRPSPKIALPPLRRSYTVNAELRTWIRSARSKFPQSSATWEEFDKLDASFSQYLGPSGKEPAMRQTADFYMQWVRQIAETQLAGRALFLFQDFSTAVVNGSHIGTKLPKQGGLSADARNPGFIAEQFMLQCLPR